MASRRMLHDYLTLPQTVYILCVGTLINRAGAFVMLFLTIYVSEELGMGKTFASYCIGAFGLGAVVSSLLGGHLADQFGRRTTMLVALLGGASALIALSLITNGWAFMGVLFLFALIVEMYRPASAAMIGDVTPAIHRPQAFGLMYIAMNLGFAVAPPIGGYLASRSFQWLFWGDAVTTALYGLVVLLLVKETLPTRRSSDRVASNPRNEMESDTPLAAAEALASLEVPDESPDAGNVGRKESHCSSRSAFRQISRDWIFLLYVSCSLLTNIVFMQSFVTLPLYLRGMGFDELQFGMMICINGILIVMFQLPLTHLLNRWNRDQVLLAGELLLAAGFGLTMFAGTAPMIVMSIAIWTFGEILQAPYKPTLVAEMAPVELRARYMGVFNLAHSMSLMIGAPLGGKILDHFGPNILWSGCSGLLLLTTMMYAFVFRQHRNRHSGIHP